MTASRKKQAGDEHRPRRPWRENIEAITMAIVMAVMLKYFIVEAYKIPTGSMQPTLMGNDETGIYDRILVDKLSFHFRDPERFEVVVFKYPLDRSKNFIKRICAVGPEWFRVENGDLWRSDNAEDDPPGPGDWRIVRRPEPVMEEQWKALDPGAPGCRRWKPLDGADDWRIEEDEVVARGPGLLRFPEQGYVVDDYRDGYPPKIRRKLLAHRPSSNAVGDLRVDGEFEASAACEAVVIELTEGDRRYRFELPGPAAEEGARPRIVYQPFRGAEAEILSASSPWRAQPGEEVAFAVQNLDDRLRLELEGETLLERDIPAAADRRAQVLLSVEGSEGEADLCRFEDLMVRRDIHYTTDRVPMTRWYVPAGHYLMLGDNTQDSSDGREWQLARLLWPDGDEGRPHVLRGQKRGNNENPHVVAGLGLTFFRDEWGELHWAPSREIRSADPPLEPAPFVPRELITGRAVVVFWPLKWGLRTWRLKWIH